MIPSVMLRKKQNNLMLFEKNESTKELITQIKVNDNVGNALFDTGTSKSCIYSSFFDKLKIYSTKKQETTIILANKLEITPKRSCKMKFRIEQLDNCIFEWNFIIVDGLNLDMILGTDFLAASKSNINLLSGTISIDGQHIFLFENEIDTVESQAIDRLNEMRTTNKIISEFKSSNPALGLIPNRKFRIETKEETL